MKELWRIALVLVAAYAFQQYSKAHGDSVDWGQFVLGAILGELTLRAFEGL